MGPGRGDRAAGLAIPARGRRRRRPPRLRLRRLAQPHPRLRLEIDGEGHKSGAYFARDLATGRSRWATQAADPGYVYPDFSVGGFIASPAVQLDPNGRALRVVGGSAVPVPGAGASSIDRATWSVRALDACSGRIEWTYRLAGPTYAASSIVNGVALVPDTFGSTLLALDAASGRPLGAAPLPGPPQSAPVVGAGSVFVGTGTAVPATTIPAGVPGLMALRLLG